MFFVSVVIHNSQRSLNAAQRNQGFHSLKQISVNQHAKMTPLGVKTASKIAPPRDANITVGYSTENRGVDRGNHSKN